MWLLTQAAPGAWANAKNFTAGNNVLSYAFATKDLNSLLNTMGLAAGIADTIVLRIKADVPQYNGAASSVPSIYSSTLTMKVTPYALSMYIPGAYQGWDPSTAPLLNPIKRKTGII